MNPRIFISYRRLDSAGHSGRLVDHLKQHLGVNAVYFDMDSIVPGEDFVESIKTAVSSCQYLFAIIGPQWLTVTDETGQRRLNDPNDTVRLEIATALKKNSHVVPVLVGGARMPREAELPDEISALARRSAFEITDKGFVTDVGQLLNKLNRIKSDARSYPMPKVSQTFGDKQKHDYLYRTFELIRQYFGDALTNLEGHNSNVETSVREITNQKFTAEIFVQGKSQAKCKIWIGNLMMGKEVGIAYTTGSFDLSNDSSYNEMIFAKADGQVMYLQFSLGNVRYLPGNDVPDKPNSEQAGEILWRYFIAGLKI